MKRLILELKPLILVMMLTIILGVLGFLAAIGIGTLAAVALGVVIEGEQFLTFSQAILGMVIFAVSRGFLRYGEQLSGHYIAFKVLAVLRDKAFAKLRTLAPAKLQGKDKGDLISLVTSDIELLEVFYAHTIAPIAIAVLTNGIVTLILGWIHPIFGFLALIYYLIVGFMIPYFSSTMISKIGVNYRQAFSKSNQFILDSLRGLKEILLFNQGQARLQALDQQSLVLNKNIEKLKIHEGIVTGITSFFITLAILTFVGLGFYFYAMGILTLTEMLMAIIIIASSFGPVTALSNLSNTLSHTFACAQRLFELFDEVPQIEEIPGELELEMNRLALEQVTFNYPNNQMNVLEDAFLEIHKKEKIALIGKSGIGKSTVIKLLMRYFDVNQGQVLMDDYSVKMIPTASLRKKQTLVEQETYLFNDTILMNIRMAQPSASQEMVIQAAKKASIHQFIESLPQGYETRIGELGGRLSSGERQRLGLARAFLHDGDVLILDEPTSNLDALNEGAILKSIKNYDQEKTVIMISHRQSSTSICEKIYQIDKGQLKLYREN